jgi:hypothetical protein
MVVRGIGGAGFAMKYREIEYTVADNGNAKWRWKIHHKLGADLMRPTLFGVGDTQEDAIVKAKATIDEILDAKSI